MPGDPILVLGDSGTIFAILTLIDPDGNEVKIKESLQTKGKISVDSFRVPSDAVQEFGALMVKVVLI